MLSARDRILDTAANLFYAKGFRAVGVDTVIAESGVAKMTLYRHFPSKDDLIAAYLRQADDRFRDWFEEVTRDLAPRAALETVLDRLGEVASGPECLGCPFVAAAGEFPDPEHPGHRVALDNKRSVIEGFERLAAEAGAADPRALAEQLLLLLDGAWSAARVFGGGNHARRLGPAARTLIAAALEQP